MTRLLTALGPVATAIAFVGCTSKEERCQAIHLQGISAELHESSENDFATRLARELPFNYTSDDYSSTKRRLRAQDRATFLAQMKEKYPADTFMWRADPTKDSGDPEPVPPPRPSEREWYSENCWEGHAR